MGPCPTDLYSSTSHELQSEFSILHRISVVPRGLSVPCSPTVPFTYYHLTSTLPRCPPSQHLRSTLPSYTHSESRTATPTYLRTTHPSLIHITTTLVRWLVCSRPLPRQPDRESEDQPVHLCVGTTLCLCLFLRPIPFSQSVTSNPTLT